MADLKFDSRIHEGKRGAVYIDFKTLEEALEFSKALPKKAKTYISAYGKINPDSGSDEEGTDRAWRSITQLALTDRFSNEKFLKAVRTENTRVFEATEGFRVNVRGV